jgi:hypothetical protein
MKKILTAMLTPLLSIVMCSFPSTAPATANELAIGKQSRLSGQVEIPLTPLADFNFKPKAEILSMRKTEVMKHADLLKGKYVPNDAVFGQITDRRPWWGTIGQAYYGAGAKSITGQAIQSQYILNPFLLAGLFSTPSLPKDKVSEADLTRKSYPTSYQASGLRWWPAQSKAEVTYAISSYKSQMCSLFGYTSYDITGDYALELINARDLGLNYVYIPPSWLYNMTAGAPMKGPIAIPHYIHCGGSCGYPGGCNNKSPACSALDSFQITRLPARLTLMFWKKAPTTGREPADMTFTINYR